MSKIWKIPVTWQMYGTMHVFAETLDEAKVLAIENEALPQGDYVDGSCVLDDEEIIKEKNNVK